MENKGDANFALELNFPKKPDNYFCCNRNNGNTYLKLTKTF